MCTQLIIPQGFDAHVHPRDGDMADLALPHTLRDFPDFLAMPNLEENPLLLGATSVQYGDFLQTVAKRHGLPCRPLLTLKYDPLVTTPDIIFEAKKLGVTGIKFYPDGVTTNSAGGVKNFASIYPVLEAAQQCGFNALFHGEHPDSELMQREPDFLEPFEKIVDNFPQLRMTMEHLSTWQAVEFIKGLKGDNVAATITAHHLYMTLTDMAGGLFKVDWMCKPILKNKRDLIALIKAAIGDDPRFFFGSDSAPHPIWKKFCADVCSGVFTAPYALCLLAEIFEKNNALHKLGEFVSIRGRNFYGLPQATETTTLIKEEWIGEREFTNGKEIVSNATANKTFAWKVLR